jgi:hypothetical protein
MVTSVGDDPSHHEMRDAVLRLLDDADTMRRVHRAAEAALRVPEDSLIAHELVAEVVEDTFTGDLRWKPSHKPPVDRLIREVLRRVERHQRRDARWAAIHLPIEAMTDDETPRATEPPLDSTDVIPLDELLRRVRARAASDRCLLRLLALNEQGVFHKDAMYQLGVPTDEYRRIHARLARIARKVAADWAAQRAACPVVAMTFVATRERDSHADSPDVIDRMRESMKPDSYADSADVIDRMRESMERWRRTTTILNRRDA